MVSTVSGLKRRAKSPEDRITNSHRLVALAVNVSRLDAGDARTGLPLLRRPKLKAGVELGVPVGKPKRFDLAWQCESGSRDVGGSLPSNALTDLRYLLDLGGFFTLSAWLSNAAPRVAAHAHLEGSRLT